jgi:hypothetical protein
VALVRDAMVIHDDGRIEGQTKDAQRLIDKLLLDSDECRAFRRRWMNIIRLAEAHAREVYEELLGYPQDLPNLSRLRPPGGNQRSEGVSQSHYARRQRGELPTTF